MRILLLIFGTLIALPSICQTDYLIRVRDPVFKSVIMTNEKTIPQVKVKPGQTIPYHLLSGQNILFVALTIDAPLDTTKKWIFEIKAVEDTGVIVPTEPTLKETVDDKDTRITYSTGWTKQAPAAWTVNFTNSDWAQTFVVNASATMTFLGRKIIVMAERRVNHGVAKIEVKQGTTVIDSQIIDMYAAGVTGNVPSAIYTSAILSQGTYTVTVSLNSITTGRDSFVLDSFLIFE